MVLLLAGAALNYVMFLSTMLNSAVTTTIVGVRVTVVIGLWIGVTPLQLVCWCAGELGGSISSDAV